MNAGWLRAGLVPDGIEVRLGELMEVTVDPGSAELLLCDLGAALAERYRQAGRWHDWLQLIGGLGVVLCEDAELSCSPTATGLEIVGQDH